MIKSDRDKLNDELEEVETIILASSIWTKEVSAAIIRRDEIYRLLKRLGKKDWF